MKHFGVFDGYRLGVDWESRMYGCFLSSFGKAKGVPIIGTPSANLSLDREAKGLSLEENLQSQLQRSSLAREDATEVTEETPLGLQRTALRPCDVTLRVY